MANLINADPTAGLKLVSSSSSDIQIQSNGVTVCTINADGLSMNTGTLAGNGPAFSAYMTGTQSFTNGVLTKVTYNTEDFDTASCYDTSNYRFTPTVDGYYWIKAVIVFNGASGPCNLWLFKNGGQFKIGGQIIQNSSAVSVNFSELVYLNGSTDYVEMYSAQSSGGTLSNLNLGAFVTFQGFLARAA